MGEDPPYVTTWFSVGGDDFDAEEFTRLVEIPPTEVWHRRVAIAKEYDGIVPKMAWCLELERRRHNSLDDAINEVLDPLWSKRDVIKSFAVQNRLAVTVVCHIYGDDMWIVKAIEATTIERLATLGSAFHFS